MIRTGEAKTPWVWIFWMSLPVGVFAFVEKCGGTALIFTMRKFIADPALISLLGSVNVAFNLLVAPLVAWRSDWLRTRWGRRKPFVVAGLLLLVPSLIVLPLARDLWTLVAAILLYQFAVDFGFTGPWSPLYYEIVPPPQRGRAVAMNRLAGVFARLFFNFVLIGQFDEVNAVKLTPGFAGFKAPHLTGEALIYFLAAALVLASAVFVMLCVREAPVAADIRESGSRQSFSAFWPGREFFKEVFGSAQARLLCLLVLASVAAQVGMGQLQPLLITEQFGYTKRALGNMHGIIILLEIGVVLPLMAWLLDRTDRFRLFQAGLWLAAFQPLAYWIYVKLIAPGQIPPVAAIIVFTALGALAKTATMLSLEPLLFDYTPPDRLGAYNAGFVA
jgi:Na+/melibiose symporter-like transporter